MLLLLLKGAKRPVGSVSPSGRSKKVAEGRWVAVSRRRSRPTVLSQVRSSESEILGTTKNTYEMAIALDRNGNRILDRHGGKSEVNFPPEEIEKLNGAEVLIHNHPGNRTFTPTDMVFGVQCRIKELRVVTDDLVYVYRYDHEKIDKLGTSLSDIEEHLRRSGIETHRGLWDKFGLGRITREELDDQWCAAQLKSFIGLCGGSYGVTKRRKGA
jgi:hypothetical protein